MTHSIGFSIYGADVGVGNQLNKGRLISRKGFISGAKGQEFRLNDPTAVVMYDDFLGDVVADQWNYVEGTDTTTADGAISETVNGVFLLTAGDSAGTVAADGAEINSGLNWKASSGNLVFQTRLKLASIASVSVFLGLTDTKSLEQAIYASGTADGITTDATDAVGFVFDTAMTTTNWWFAGVKNDVDATKQNVGYAPVADTYATFRIEVDSSGNALGFYNGNPVGALMSGAVTASVALTPSVLIRPKSATAGKTCSIDYIYVACDRV